MAYFRLCVAFYKLIAKSINNKCPIELVYPFLAIYKKEV